MSTRTYLSTFVETFILITLTKLDESFLFCLTRDLINESNHFNVTESRDLNFLKLHDLLKKRELMSTKIDILCLRFRHEELNIVIIDAMRFQVAMTIMRRMQNIIMRFKLVFVATFVRRLSSLDSRFNLSETTISKKKTSSFRNFSMNLEENAFFVDLSKNSKKKTSSFNFLKNSDINKQNEKSDINSKKNKSDSYKNIYDMSESEENHEKNKIDEFDNFSVVEVESNVEQK